MATRERPLSPHLGIYRKQLTSVLSILHRISGIGLSIGAFGVAWFLVALAGGDASYARFLECATSPVGLALLFAWTAGLNYHLLNGLRHLAWDAGKGFDLPTVYRSGWTVVVLAIVATAAIWFFALTSGGAA
jgi:succinate dehydrogenase / fumarate reductase cytochrome b subunit